MVGSRVYADIFRGVTLAADSKAADAWDIAGHEGGMDALGIGGAVTGKGADCLVIDDPLKSRAEAESKLMRDKVWDAYTDDLYTRLQPGGAAIVTATRWHADDLTGRLLRFSGEQWHVLTLPALDDNGSALWPERYPVDVLEDIRRTLGEYSWASLYQQRPMPAEGGLFKRAWLEPRGIVPPMKYAVRYWDLAMSTKTQADYTVGCKVGVGEDGHLYVTDVHRERIEWPDLADRLADIMIADGASVVQGVEEQGYMSRAVQDLNMDDRLRGYVVFGYKVDKDKFTRALRPAAKAGAGVLHTVQAHWTDAFIDELCAFPNAEHDDQVDALSGAIAMLESDVTGQGQVSYGTFRGIEGTY